MKVAVTYKDGEVFQHFGHTEQFKFYEIENDKVVSENIVKTLEGGHSALASLLQDCNADAVICGGIGGGAKTALLELGIKLYGGVSGNADKAVQNLINNSLVFNPEVKCNHFEEHHGDEEHHHCHTADGCLHNNCSNK